MMAFKLATPLKVLFDDKVGSVAFPGESGYFEILPFHKPLLSRLSFGTITIDSRWVLNVLRGIVRVEMNKVTAIVETEDGS